MSETPEWVTVDEVIVINESVVAATCEPHLMASQGGLESAVARPQNHYNYGPEESYDDLVLLGVKLCVGISQSQAFQQGNKRTGFVAMLMFFNKNGYHIDRDAHGHIADLILASAHPDHALRLCDDDFANHLDPYVVEGTDAALAHGFTGSSAD